MELELVYECAEGLEPALSQDEVYALALQVLQAEGVERFCSLSVSYVDDARIRELNAEWRDVDTATDVLSFECENPFDPDIPQDVPVELGDIVLAPHFIQLQSEAFHTTFADEERLMLVHALLHLLGYEHEEDEEASRMQAREEEILAQLDTDGSLTDVVLARHREEA